MKTASWVIREKVSKKVIMETFDPQLVAALSSKKYEAIPILQYLQSINGHHTDDEIDNVDLKDDLRDRGSK